MAGYIPRTFVDDLLTRLNIVDVIDARVPLKKAGKNYKACCPFHSEKTPSFNVNIEKQFYHCFGCGVSGTAISFLMDYEHMEFVEAVEELAKTAGVEVPYEGAHKPKQEISRLYGLHELMAQVCQFYISQVKHASAHEYLLRRGLSENTVQAYDIGFAPSGWDNLIRKFSSNAKVIAQLVDTGMVVVNEKGKMYDRFRERIMFPIRDRRGRVIAFGGRVINDGVPKYLNSPETEIFHKSAELYGLNTVIKSGSGKDCLLVVEGYMDVVSLANQGVTNAVATLGTAITEQHVQILTKQTSTIVYCFDGDAAGSKAAWRALETSLPYLQKGLQIKFMFLPDGEDPDTMVSRLGAAGFEVLINKAKPLSDFMLEKLLSEANYQTTEGEANLIEKARPLINKLPKGGFVNLVVGRLAKYVQLPEPVLLQQLRGGDEAAGRRSYRRSAPNMRKLASERPSIIKSAIAMLLEKPALALDVKDPASLKRLLVPGVALLHDLLVFVQENPNISTGGILEHWRDTEESKFLLKILAWQHHVPEKGLDAEFLAAIASLFCQLKEQELENLLNKSKVSPLSEKEKQRLSLLMKEIAK